MASPRPDTEYLLISGRRRRQSRVTPSEDCTPVRGVPPLSRTRELAAEMAAARLEHVLHRAGFDADVPSDAILVRVVIEVTPDEANRLAAAAELLVPAKGTDP